MSLTSRLVYRRNTFGLRRIVKELLALYCVELPGCVPVGAGLVLSHRAFGLVVHPASQIGANVRIHQGVTIGMADSTYAPPASCWPLIQIEDGVVLGAGAKVLSGSEGLIVGARTQVGANAVLLQSTGPDEVWVGVPARRIR